MLSAKVDKPIITVNQIGNDDISVIISVFVLYSK